MLKDKKNNAEKSNAEKPYFEIQITGNEGLVKKLRKCDFVAVKATIKTPNEFGDALNGKEIFEQYLLIFYPIGRDSYRKKGVLINLPYYQFYVYDNNKLNDKNGGKNDDKNALANNIFSFPFSKLRDMFFNAMLVIKVENTEALKEAHGESETTIIEQAKALKDNTEVFGFVLAGVSRMNLFDLSGKAKSDLETLDYIRDEDEMLQEEFPYITLTERLN